MLDPQYLGHVADELEKQFAELEESLLKDIARRIKENKFENTSTAQYQIDRLKAMGLQYDEMQKQIAKTLGLSEDQVSSIIRDSAYESVDRDNAIFKTAYDDGLINRFHFEKDGLKDIILAGIDATNGEIRNICKTTAKTASKLFADKLDQAYLSVASGAFSVDEAVKSAVTDIGKRGISWVDYKSGAHRRPDTVVRTALRTGVNQTSCRCQDKNFDDMGGNLVEVTSHMGARPDHALWQGQIYWRRKKYKNYKNFEQSTGYGSGDGLGGWNCRHSFYPFFEGLSSKSFESYYEGENQERYELEQEQRYNERMIREWKRRSSVNYSGGIDNSKEARKVKEWTQRQSDFLKEHPELKRNYGREEIAKRNQQIVYSKIKNSKLKEFYAMDKNSVRMNVEVDEYLIHKDKYETAYIYDSNGKILLKKKGIKDEVEFADEELKLMKDAIVTHNHPRGTTLSPDDIYMAIANNLQEVRATGEKGTYVLRRNENLHLMPTSKEFNKEYNKILSNCSKAYLKKFGKKVNENHYQQVIQMNGMSIIAKKYGLLYWRELNEV